MGKYEILPLIATFFILIAFSSIVLKVHMTKKTENLTYIWIILIGLAQVLLIAYGIINNYNIIYITSILILIGILYIFYNKIIYEETEKVEIYLQNKDIL